MSTISDLFDFTGKTVLVTGASGGLGAGIARVFAAAGAAILIHFHSGRERAENLRDSLPGPGRHECVQADGSSENEIGCCMKQVARLCGESGLSVLINNAGVYPSSALLDTDLATWHAVMDTNLSSMHLFTREAAKIMRPGSAIVNIASIEGLKPVRAHAHYAVSKAAVIHYTMAAALELAPLGIRVNSVSPGLVDRPGLVEDWPEGYKRYVSAAPLGRVGTPDEIGYSCLFLASKAADWITGVNLVVDGGASVVAPQG
ncbi:MAG: SDR family NAD(P)-dependent oxidoreductase [Rectinema subterraneum]|jgi:glucose 1-dehydrogenase/3-oxoacyl-[acyl-carrier protein] reductase